MAKKMKKLFALILVVSALLSISVFAVQDHNGIKHLEVNTTGKNDFIEENPPLSDIPEREHSEEEIPEEDPPLADVPSTGDFASLYAAASVVSAAALIFLGKKNKDED